MSTLKEYQACLSDLIHVRERESGIISMALILASGAIECGQIQNAGRALHLRKLCVSMGTAFSYIYPSQEDEMHVSLFVISIIPK